MTSVTSAGDETGAFFESDLPTMTAAGRRILRAHPVPGDAFADDGYVVLCVIEDPGAVHPYVTWWMRAHDRSCVAGHYFATLPEAEADFAARAERQG